MTHAVGLTRVVSSFLFGVEATDPVTFGVVVFTSRNEGLFVVRGRSGVIP